MRFSNNISEAGVEKMVSGGVHGDGRRDARVVERGGRAPSSVALDVQGAV